MPTPPAFRPLADPLTATAVAGFPAVTETADAADFDAAPFQAAPALELTRKRRKGYPSETQVRRGRRWVHGDKELVEKLGRNDPCPCGSTRRFKELLPARRLVRRLRARRLLP
ncbi:SEC-C metal-binding domain-containing protein [Pseudomonas sp. CGJS7]|uniref:SEC-C metal-binding domain-containing protein n=1 Tax=Pseudomonas sp. CGJS7 TaxID=3109348 RepID=UPI003FA7D87E